MPARLRLRPTEKFRRYSRRLSGGPDVEPDVPLVFYTDGAASGREGVVAGLPRRFMGWATAWAYVDVAGRWGLGHCAQVAVSGGDRPDCSVIAELRAVHEALQRAGGVPVSVRMDSQHGLLLLDRWRRGGVRLPAGYWSLGSPPALEVLRRRVARPGDMFEAAHVPGHAGVALNEVAHQLAQIGMHWGFKRISREEAFERAQRVVAFGR